MAGGGEHPPSWQCGRGAGQAEKDAQTDRAPVCGAPGENIRVGQVSRSGADVAQTMNSLLPYSDLN